jgi:K+-transporting ATPase ATPase B chain
MSTESKARSLFDPEIVRGAFVASFVKLDPRHQVKNPVMFVVLVGSVLTTALFVQALVGHGEAPAWFILAVSVWLWFTVLFANFAEAMAEGRGKAQADALRRARRDVVAKRLERVPSNGAFDPTKARTVQTTSASPEGSMRPGRGRRLYRATADPRRGGFGRRARSPASAPVIREAGGDHQRDRRTLSTGSWCDHQRPRRDHPRPHDLHGRGAKRRSPNEIALNILLAALTIVFLLATVTLRPFHFAVNEAGRERGRDHDPHHVAGLIRRRSAASSRRSASPAWTSQANVIAMSGRSVEAAGDVDVLLLDKTGTITLGNRRATAFPPRRQAARLADAAQLASLADETPEGRSIVVLAKEEYGLRERDIHAIGAHFVPFSAQTRMSGVNLNGRQVRKGAAEAIERFVESLGGSLPVPVRRHVDAIAREGGTPLWSRRSTCSG